MKYYTPTIEEFVVLSLNQPCTFKKKAIKVTSGTCKITEDQIWFWLPSK
jgi:hypothetical protein